MLFQTLLPILLVSASAFAQLLDSPAESTGATNSQDQDGTSFTVTELDTTEPSLWQMAAFAARQMSTKQRRFKLATLTSAEQIDSLTRLKVTLQRVTEGAPIDKNDVLYCTVDVKSNAQGQQWEVDSFGCTLPAMVRRRRPAKKLVQPLEPAEPIIATNKFEAPLDNVISDNQIDSNEEKPSVVSEVAKNQVKRQALFRPYYQTAIAYEQPRYVQQYAYVPRYPVYYQAYY